MVNAVFDDTKWLMHANNDLTWFVFPIEKLPLTCDLTRELRHDFTNPPIHATEKANNMANAITFREVERRLIPMGFTLKYKERRAVMRVFFGDNHIGTFKYVADETDVERLITWRNNRLREVKLNAMR